MPTYSFRDIKDGAGNPMFGRGSDLTGQYATNVSGSQTAGDRWCIAVIDEVSPSSGTITSQYAAFRAAWPQRKLFLLVPNTLGSPIPQNPGELYIVSGGGIYIPQQAMDERATGLFTGPTQVARDGGNVSLLSDWFTLCGLGVLAPGAKIGLFVDNSGSMTTSTVQASYNKFIADVAAAGLSIITVTNGNEEWTEPFRTMSGT